jgi:hypothetical protein
MSTNSESSQFTNIQSYVALFRQALDISSQKDLKLQRLASSLDFDVGRHGIYYELKNGPGLVETDLAFYFPNAVPAKRFFARLAALDMPESWLRVLQALLFFPDGARCGTCGVPGAWLEFDTHGALQTRPNIFFSPSKNEIDTHAWARSVISQVRQGGLLHDAVNKRLNDLFRALRLPATVVHIGFMLPRGTGDSVKFYLNGMTEHQTSLLQNAMDFTVSNELHAFATAAANHGLLLFLVLNISPEQPVQAAWDIFTQKGCKRSNEAWSNLVGHLPHDAHELRKHLLKKPVVQNCFTSSSWPGELKRELDCNPCLAQSLLVTKLSHIKAFKGLGGAFDLKRYYYQYPVFKTKAGAYCSSCRSCHEDKSR